jgi:hypothetical protein
LLKRHFNWNFFLVYICGDKIQNCVIYAKSLQVSTTDLIMSQFMENSSFFAENMFSLFFPQKYVGTQSFGSRSIFCPLTSKISFFSPKILKIRLFFLFFCWTRKQKPVWKCLNNYWWNWNEKKILKILVAKKHR